MKVVDQDNGKEFFLDRTDAFSSDIASWRASECNHDVSEIRKRPHSGGGFHFYRQCIQCGSPIGSALKKSPEYDSANDWDEKTAGEYNAAREAERLNVFQKHVRIQRDRSDGFQREYEKYLQSDEWAKRRAKVLRRANGICEGCGDRKATQVHHLTYKHIYEEFLFELVAVCEECHYRIHPEKHEEDLSDWRDGHPCEACRFQDTKDSRRWCGILDRLAADALAFGGGCGPERHTFEQLR